MMNAVVSVAVWMILNTAIVAGVLRLWNRGADHSARQGQRMVMLISFLMFIPGLLPLTDHTKLLLPAFLIAIAFGAVAAVFGIVLDVRERAEARRRRKDALLRGYPTAPTIIGGWGAFWIGAATYFLSGFVLLAASFAWTWGLRWLRLPTVPRNGGTAPPLNPSWCWAARPPLSRSSSVSLSGRVESFARVTGHS